MRRSKLLVKFLERLSFGACALPHLLRARYDIIHIQKPYDLPVGVLLRALTGSKLLFGCHGTDYIAADRSFMRWIDGAVSCSVFNAHQIAEHYGIQPVVVYNGFDAARFFPRSRDEALRDRFARPGDILLLYAGRLIGWKGISFLLQALARLDPTVKLLIAGEGPARGELEQEARSLGVSERLTFLGRIEPAQLADYYLISDIVVLPSLTHETFSIVACEALACKRPVVGSNIGGIPELVEELVPPGDAMALAEKLQALAADPARREQIAERGYARVSSFLTWEATTARVTQVYRRLLQGERVLAGSATPASEKAAAGSSRS